MRLKDEYNRKKRRKLDKLLRLLMKRIKCKRLYIRFQVIRLALNGTTYKEISFITGVSEPTIVEYVKKFREDAISGLRMHYSTGRPPKLSEDQELELYETIVNKVPDQCGFKVGKNWNVPIIRIWIEQEFEVKYSKSGVRDLLHRLNLSFTCPTYTLAKADPKKQEEFIKRFNRLKNDLLHDTIDRIFFVDETMIRDYQAISKTWFPKGQQKKIKTFGKHWGAKIIGGIDYESGEVFCIQREKYTAKEFLSFLKIMVKNYKNERIVIILDNAPIHHAKLLKPFLEEHEEDLTLVFLPPYSPQLNIIEGLWGWLKEIVINNVFFDSAFKIHRAVKDFINYINENPQQTIDRLCVML